MEIDTIQKQHILIALQSYQNQLKNAYYELNSQPEIQDIILLRSREISSLLNLFTENFDDNKKRRIIFNPKDAIITGIACCIDVSGKNFENIKPYITDRKLDQCVEAVRNIIMKTN